MSMYLLECYSNYNFIKTTVFNYFNVHNLIMEGVTLLRKHSFFFLELLSYFIYVISLVLHKNLL